jgi:predicted transposase YbfD/YdcC
MAVTNGSQILREHWGVENSLHWLLDVAFNEENNMNMPGNEV